MRKPPGIEVTVARTVSVLSISPFPDDHSRLKEIFERPDFNCVFDKADTAAAAARFLGRNPVSVVVCEYGLPLGSWQEVLEVVSNLSRPSTLIVTSRLADERTWAEILNLGAYDLLAKPFNDEEVYRVVNAAWRHWQYESMGQASRHLYRQAHA